MTFLYCVEEVKTCFSFEDNEVKYANRAAGYVVCVDKRVRSKLSLVLDANESHYNLVFEVAARCYSSISLSNDILDIFLPLSVKTREAGVTVCH